MEDLGRRVAEFMWHEDTYHAQDSYDNIMELITEVVKQLYVTVYRMAIAGTLKAIAEWHESDETASEASLLYREVMSL